MLFNRLFYKKIKDITLTDYEPHNTRNKEIILIDNSNIMGMLEDLIECYEDLKKEKEDMEKYFLENYKKIEGDDYEN